MAAPRIIIGLDPSKRPLDPLRLGGEIARGEGLPVVVATVLPRGPGQDQVGPAMRDDLLALARSVGVDAVEAHVLFSSSPARALHEQSERADTAFVVVGSTTRGPLRRVLPGSVAQQLLSGASCPVAVAPHGYAERERRELALIGVAYDGSEESERALASARRLAGGVGARVRIVTVVERLAFGAVTVGAMTPEAPAGEVAEQGLRARHDAAVAGSEADGVFLQGDPAAVLLEQSREVDVLFAGSRGYGPIGAVLLGSTTRQLTQSSACPLIVVPRAGSR